MNTQVLNHYGINFIRQSNGRIKVSANSANLSIYIDRFTSDRYELQRFISTLNIALNGNYSSIPYDDIEWTKELGSELYSGRINANLTFDLFMDDHYNNTIENFPLYDIREVFASFLEFLR